ncbi:MAG: histidine phosphatase family protein [Chloroflexota bacterium]
MTTLVLIRHGQTDWNVEGRWQGQTDLPLNDRGRQEAQRVAQDLGAFEFAALYSSDLRRALETAQIIGAALGLAVTPERRLREINLGVWQGMLSTDIRARYPDAFRQWHTSPLTVHPPDGEDITALAARVIQAVNEIITRHPGQRIGIVAHELPIAVVRCRAMDVGLERLRSMIPATGASQQVIVTGGLTWAVSKPDGAKVNNDR